MKNNFSGIFIKTLGSLAIAVAFLGPLETQAATCTASHSYRCKPVGGVSSGFAISYIYGVDCASQAILSSMVKTNPDRTCVPDTSVLYSQYRTQHSCAELGWQQNSVLPGPRGFAVNYDLNQRRARVNNYCANGAPHSYEFNY